jgi:pantoate--beta-alanine ligase
MRVVSSRPELQAALSDARANGLRIALVPTMGALHAGHAALMGAARVHADLVVVSIFVNPLQFGPGEDLSTYPRSLDDDLRICESHGVEVVFTPTVETVYPGGDPQVTVDPGPLAGELEGATRPGHFRGVLTVVVKLLGLVEPDVAVFGDKDYQQLVLIRRCMSDLCIDVQVVGVDTVRAPDGLALSSRNRYLNDSERSTALVLGRALRAGRAAGGGGPEAVSRAARSVLAEAPDVEVDYLAVRGTDLGPAPAAGAARLLVAARVGPARLIDNIAVELGGQPDDSGPTVEPVKEAV